MNRRSPSLTSLVALTMILLAVGYPLSFGPVCLLFDSGYLSEDNLALFAVIETVYAPIGWGYENVESVEWFYDWYLYELLGFDS